MRYPAVQALCTPLFYPVYNDAFDLRACIFPSGPHSGHIPFYREKCSGAYSIIADGSRQIWSEFTPFPCRTADKTDKPVRSMVTYIIALYSGSSK